jgi:hypothetical protein
MFATIRTKHFFRSKIKAAIPLWVIRSISTQLIRRLPVQRIPGWAGRSQGLSVPKSVVPFTMPLPSGSANIKIILALTKSILHLEGDLAECGVYQGSTLIPVGLYLAQNNARKKVFGFDSFVGFGDLACLDPGWDASTRANSLFTDTSYEMVQAKIERLNLTEHVIIVKGFFSSRLGAVEDRRFCFVHLDCDLYESYKTCLGFFYNRMVPGGVILFDEYNDLPWPGCNRAVDEFLLDKPETLMEISSDNYIRYFIRKS